MAPLPVVVLGAATCEDTAITVSRLAAIGIPFEVVDVDADPSAAERVAGLNDGRRVTPTVVLGADQLVVAEPTLERLGELLAAAGHELRRPTVRELHGEATTRPIPIREVPGADGTTFSISRLRGRRQVALFLGHGAGCLACFGYARQLAMQEAALSEADGTAIVVVSGSVDEAASWREGVSPNARIVADPDGAWKRQIAAAVGESPAAAILLVLDRFLAARAVSSAAEAGGLIDPSEATAWLRFLVLECPECSGEIPWETA